MTKTYLENNTVRFKAKFYDFNNELIDPTIVKLIIYSSRYQREEEYILDESNRESTGIYFYDLIVEANNKGNKTFYYEYYGEINGKPSINRGKYIVTFIE